MPPPSIRGALYALLSYHFHKTLVNCLDSRRPTVNPRDRLFAQDNSFTESYISTIGVDFVRLRCVCLCFARVVLFGFPRHHTNLLIVLPPHCIAPFACHTEVSDSQDQRENSQIADCELLAAALF